MAEKNYVLSEDQFRELLAAATKSNQAMAPVGVQPLSPDQQVNVFVDAMKKGNLEDRPLHKIEKIACMSLETGSSFTAVVASSKTFPEGRVVTLEDYAFPPGIDMHVDEGGLVPNGMALKLKDGSETKDFKHWKWLNYYQKDLQRYVGRDAAWLKRMATLAQAEKPAQVPGVTT